MESREEFWRSMFAPVTGIAAVAASASGISVARDRRRLRRNHADHRVITLSSQSGFPRWHKWRAGAGNERSNIPVE